MLSPVEQSVLYNTYIHNGDNEKKIGSATTENVAFIITLNKINVVFTHNVQYTFIKNDTKKRKNSRQRIF